jgi:hypothetical protein
MMKKKMKRFQDGGVADENFTAAQLEFLGGADRTDPYILARMRKAAPDAPKEMQQKESFATAEGQNKNIGDDVRARAMKSISADADPISKPKKKAPARTVPAKAEAKKEVVVEKTKEEPKKPAVSEKQKTASAEPSFFRGTKGYNLSDVTSKIKSMLPEGSDRRTEKQKAAGEEPSFLRGTKGYNLPKFKMPEGSDRRTEKQKAAGEKPSFLRGTKGYNLSDFKKGGVVKSSSASKRADGCAVRGKTRA